MQTFKRILAITACLFSSWTFAQDIISMTVPFTYIGLRDGQMLDVNYKFRENTVIYCREANVMGLFAITWPYNGERVGSKLPMRLKNKESYPGAMADNEGVITIKNYSGQDGTFISCTFEKQLSH